MIRLLGWRDPWQLQAFAMRERDRFKGKAGAHSLIVLDGDKEHPNYASGKGWAHLKIAINHARALVAQGPAELASATVEALDPRAGSPWANHELVQVRLGIRCNPSAYLCWPPSMRSLLPGEIVVIPPGWSSVVNAGESQVISLVLTLRPRTQDGEDQL